MGKRQRHAAACLGLLLVILATTAGITWWSWQTLQDRRVQLGADESLQRSEPDDGSLVDDLVARNGTRAKAPTGRAEPGPAVLERPSGSRPAARPQPVSVDGRLLAGLLIVLATGAATLASREVLRRYRLRAALVELELEPVPGDRPPWSALDAAFDTAADADVARDGEEEGKSDSDTALHTLPLEQSGPPAAAAAGPVPAAEAGLVDELPLARLVVEQRQPDPDDEGTGRRTESTPGGAGGSRAPVRSEQHAGSSSLDRDGERLAERSSTAADPPMSPQASGYEVATEAVVHERLYDRRVSRHVPYVQPGWLWWSDANAPLTVQEIGLMGLRCLLNDSAVPAPALGEEVRVFFPVNGSTLKVTGRVQSKEHTGHGTDVEVDFLELPQDAEALVRQVLVSSADGLR